MEFSKKIFPFGEGPRLSFGIFLGEITFSFFFMGGKGWGLKIDGKGFLLGGFIFFRGNLF